MHLLWAQKATNNTPHEAHGGRITPAECLFGTKEPSVLLPHPEELVALMGMSRWVGARLAGSNVGQAEMHLHAQMLAALAV